MRNRVFLATIMLMAAIQSATAATIYVDSGIASSCSDYAPSSRTCGNGSERAFSALDAGVSASAAGDTVLVRGGTYGQLVVSASGTSEAPILIQGYPGEQAVISGSGTVGLWIINRTNVAISDLTVRNVEGFGRIEGSSNIRISRVDFSNAGASGTTGSLKFVRSTHNVVDSSSFDNGSDLLLLQDASDFNIVRNSQFGSAAHSLISIRCSSNNVIRGNIFDNPDQKAMEVFDCEGVSDAPVRLDSTKRNLIERNKFFGTAASGQSNDYNAIQHGGQQTIVRFNDFAHNLGGGVNYQYYSDESLYVNSNRLYNNTFYDNQCYAIIGQSGSSSRFYDNRVRNNLLYLNRNCSGSAVQVSIQDSSSVILTDNMQANSDPGFAGAANNNFSLVASSPAVNAGSFLALAVGSSGGGTSITVDDASWFYDGFGINMETGDVIRIEGHQETARIIAIDYSRNVLTLDSPLVWSNGDGVHTYFSGNAPDQGAHELGMSLETRPKPPADLQAN